jgi:hypothetical protein
MRSASKKLREQSQINIPVCCDVHILKPALGNWRKCDLFIEQLQKEFESKEKNP